MNNFEKASWVVTAISLLAVITVIIYIQVTKEWTNLGLYFSCGFIVAGILRLIGTKIRKNGMRSSGRNKVGDGNENENRIRK